MGITLQAQVELWRPADPGFGMHARWEELSRWELGKDGFALTAVADQAFVGWPPDVAMSEEDLLVIDQGRHWCMADNLPLIGEGCARRSWQSFQASLVPLVGYASLDSKTPLPPCRVVFWEM